MMSIGSFLPSEQPQDLSAESFVPDHTQSVATVPLEAFPTDAIQTGPEPAMNPKGAVPHLSENSAVSGGMQPVESSLRKHSNPAAQPVVELAEEKSLKLQKSEQWHSHLMQTLSNMRKPTDGSLNNITDNIK